MSITTKAIVFSALKYGDTSLIVKAFTEQAGLKSYMLKGVLTSKKGKLRTAYFQPMNQLEIVAVHRQNRGLHQIREVRLHYTYTTIDTEMDKKAITLFLAEVLGYAIKEEESNPQLFQFLEASFQWLDTHEDVANFHLFFLLQLSKYLGFYPREKNSHKNYFDLVEGEFVDQPSAHPYINGEQLLHFRAFLGITFEAIHTIGLRKQERQELLQALVLYFELHLQGFKKPRSLAVLNEVFN